MHRALVFALAVALPAVPCPAQQGAPEPAPELEKLAVLEGDWRGSGTVTMTAGGPARKWTSRTTRRWVMGGHFLQEDTIIEVEDLVGHFVTHGYYGWDRENRRYVLVLVSNSDRARLLELTWLDERTLQRSFPTRREGVPGLEHSEMVIGEGEIRLGQWVLQGRPPMRKVVEGVMKEVEGAEPMGFDPRPFFGPNPEPMRRLASIEGNYAVSGEWIPEPGAAPVEVTGEEVIRPIFGGRAVEAVFRGDVGAGDGYAAWTCTTWDEVAGAYRRLGVDDRGRILRSEGRWLDEDTLVHTFSGLRAGMPAVHRTVIELDGDGGLKSAARHAVRGGHEPEQTLRTSYDRQK